VLSALHHAGYAVSADSEPGPSTPILLIGSHSGGPPGRESVRETINRLDTVNVEGHKNWDVDLRPARFTDE
jgi:hypothetical protein